MNRTSPPNKIVAKFTQQQLFDFESDIRQQVSRQLDAETQALKRQREQLQLDQIRAVTELIKETTSNLSKCGYLLGKLNKDNSR